MTREKIGFYVLCLIMLILAVTGTFKLVGAAEAAEEFGNPNAPYVLAAVEYLALICLVVPRTRLLGVILAASYFGGVICFQWLVEGIFPIVGILINVVVYVGAALYRPWLTIGGDPVPTAPPNVVA